jgi:hypothetical protein
MAAAKKVCASCNEGFIGRSGASYCSPRCKQRAHRSRKGRKGNAQPAKRVTATARTGATAGAHCAEARALLAALDAELKENSEERGLSDDEALSWSAAESAVLDMVACAVDRKVDLWARYLASDDDKVRVKLSTEIRLLESSIARLLKQVSTDLPEPESRVSQKARAAARVRWDHGTR